MGLEVKNPEVFYSFLVMNKGQNYFSRALVFSLVVSSDSVVF